MKLTRRETLVAGASALAVFGMGLTPARAAVEDAVAEFTGGADIMDGGVDLVAPEIAENGNTVPIEVSAEGATAIMLLATGNPTPGVATFNFGPLAGSTLASTRIRLSQTQDVMAIAKMQDGTFHKAVATVKVTIGGCGG